MPLRLPLSTASQCLRLLLRSSQPPTRQLPPCFRSAPTGRRLLHASTMAEEFKLKGLSKVELKDGQKQEAEVEGVDGKVLLLNYEGKVSALSPKCTHYGAPLLKGVLSPGGRITCPWHGACFNVGTGDVEDAPALDPLGTFEVIQRDGAVYIKGEKKNIGFSSRNPNVSCKSPTKGKGKVLVVGGGSATVGLTEALRAGGYKGEVVVISKEGGRPLDRTKFSKALLADVDKAAWRTQEWYNDAGIELINDEVTSVSFKDKTVETKSGQKHTYTKLVLASGGTPRWLPLEGLKGDLKGVHIIRSIDHAQGIVADLGDSKKKIVVVGSSFIGMEVANCLVGKEHDVTVIGMESEPMEKVMSAKIGRIFRGLLEKKGVKFHMSSGVEKASPSSSDSSRVGAVHLKDGTTISADLVIEGVGVGPATEYLRDSKEISLEKDGSIAVDDNFAVPSLDSVYAVGDIATYPYHGPGGNGAPVRIEHWNVAQNAGRSVAHLLNAAAGSNNAPPKSNFFIPVFWSAIGAQLRYCGNTAVTDGFDDVVVKGETDPEKVSWVAYYAKGEQVVAVASMMKDPYVMKCAELMRKGAMPSKGEIERGVDVMDVEVPVEARL